MSFLNPIGWAFLCLAPALVVLYLRRTRRRAATVSTLLFWQRALGENPRRAWLGKLRQWLSLVLHLLVLLLMILALARPRFGETAAAPQSAVIVLDARARMQAVEPGGETRFAQALKLAHRAAAEARDGSEIAVLTAGAAPQAVSPFSSDPSALAKKLDALAPSDAHGDLAPALALAQELLATRPGGSGAHRVLVFTDRRLPDSPELQGVQAVAVGSARENVAITRFAARPELSSPQTVDVLLEIANFGTQPVRGNVEIRCEDALLDVKPFELAPGARKSDIFPALPALKSGAGPGRLSARLELAGSGSASDALALDDIAYATLPAVTRCHVLLVTRGNWFLEKLLAADSSVRFELLAPSALQPQTAAAFDAVIYDDCGPADLGENIGNALFIKTSPFKALSALEKPPITEQDNASPLLRFVNWNNVTIQHAAELAKPERDGWKFETPLRSIDHPLIIAGSRTAPGEERRVAVFAFDIADTDLPLRVAFPLLVSNTVHWLANSRAPLPAALDCGQTLALAPMETAALESASGAAPVSAGLLQPLKNGFYEIQPPDSAGNKRLVAVNTFSDEESDLQTAASPDSAALSQKPFAAVASSDLWQRLAMAALALFTAEWWLFHRRQTE